MAENWFVYICKANTGRYYTGIAKDPNKRLSARNQKTGSQFARDQGPFQLVYTSQPYPKKSDARKRETQIKGWTRIKKGKLISGEWV